VLILAGGRQNERVRDPHEILGVPAGANSEEVTAAYRRLAKRLHPDHAGAGEQAARRMAEVNLAYAVLREGLTGGASEAGAPPAPDPRPPVAGHWLEEHTRRRLGRELVEALEEGEPVRLVVPAATWASPSSILVLTDRRLLWLLEDAVMGRVRSLALRDVVEADVRASWPRRRRAKLRLRARDGRRHTFTELSLSAAARVADAVRHNSRPAAEGAA
jgi:DnaJ domain